MKTRAGGVSLLLILTGILLLVSLATSAQDAPAEPAAEAAKAVMQREQST
jgi:hypothetical protein